MSTAQSNRGSGQGIHRILAITGSQTNGSRLHGEDAPGRFGHLHIALIRCNGSQEGEIREVESIGSRCLGCDLSEQGKGGGSGSSW